MGSLSFEQASNNLKAYLEQIQSHFLTDPEFYTQNLEGKNYSLQDKVQNVKTAMSNLIIETMMRPVIEKDPNQFRIKNSKPITDAVNELLIDLTYAKTLPNNPIPQETYDKDLSNPLMEFANYFLILAGRKPYVIVSTQDSTKEMQSTMSKINDAREPPTASQRMKKAFQQWRDTVSTDKKKPSVSDKPEDPSNKTSKVPKK
jgi:hypothetical protein